MSRFVGLIGKARVGKDTVAEHLVEQYGLMQYAFADPLKDMLEAVFGDKFRGGDREQVIDWLGKSPRQLMQTLGTEWGRDCVHPDLWVLFAEQEWLKVQARKAPGLVISDVRFKNEAEWIHQAGGLLIEISRPGAEEISAHVSEAGFAQFSHLPRELINNDGSLDDLFEQVDDLVMEFLRGR